MKERGRKLQWVQVLELLDFNWHTTAGGRFVEAEGRVMNVSGRPLKNVEVIVIFFAESGEMVTSSTALISYNPILAGQMSTFKVITQHNPAMKDATVEFKDLLGGSILTRNK